MSKQSGYSFTEVLISMALALGILLSAESYLSFINQNQKQLNNLRLAHQLLLNIASELKVSQNPKDANQVRDWQHYIQKFLPTAILRFQFEGIHPQLEIAWPSQYPLSNNCSVITPHQTCLGLQL